MSRPAVSSVLVLAIAAAIVARPAAAGPSAPPHHDVELYVESGVIKTGAIDFEEPGTPIELGVRVFPGAFGDLPNGTDEPGFNATGNTSASPQPNNQQTAARFGETFDIFASLGSLTCRPDQHSGQGCRA